MRLLVPSCPGARVGMMVGVAVAGGGMFGPPGGGHLALLPVVSAMHRAALRLIVLWLVVGEAVQQRSVGSQQPHHVAVVVQDHTAEPAIEHTDPPGPMRVPAGIT